MSSRAIYHVLCEYTFHLNIRTTLKCSFRYLSPGEKYSVVLQKLGILRRFGLKKLAELVVPMGTEQLQFLLDTGSTAQVSQSEHYASSPSLSEFHVPLLALDLKVPTDRGDVFHRIQTVGVIFDVPEEVSILAFRSRLVPFMLPII